MLSFKQFIAEQADDSEKVHLVHYSNHEGLTHLSGSKHGTGIKGAEQERIHKSKDDRIKKRVYFYRKPEGGHPQPESGLGPHVHETHSTKLYDMTKKNHPDSMKVSKTMKKYMDEGEERNNAFERAILDHGYHGHVGHRVAVVLNRDVEVKHTGHISSKKVVPHKETHEGKQHWSMFHTLPSSSGTHESSDLTDEQHGFIAKHREEIKKVAPSFKLEYGKASVKTEHLEDLKNHLDKHHKGHPL